MAGEHFETIPLALPTLNNENLNKKCNFLYQIETEASLRRLTKAVGQSRAQELLTNPEVMAMF